MATTCPHCELLLTSDEASRGTCPSCGKGLSAAPAPRPEQTARTRPESPDRPRNRLGVHWGWFVGVMIVLPIGIALLTHSIFDDGPRSQSTSRRTRSVEALIGARGTEALSGLVFLGMAAGFGYACLKNANGKGIALAGTFFMLNGGAVLAAFIVPAVQRGSEAAWQKQVASPLSALTFGEPVEFVQADVPIRQKVLIWDATKSKTDPTQAVLPPDRAAAMHEPSFTAIVILKTRDEEATKYTSGAVGYTRVLTIGVVDYPEKKVIGSYLIRAQAPAMAFRDVNDTGPIVGDASTALKNWILSNGKRTF